MDEKQIAHAMRDLIKASALSSTPSITIWHAADKEHPNLWSEAFTPEQVKELQEKWNDPLSK